MSAPRRPSNADDPAVPDPGTAPVGAPAPSLPALPELSNPRTARSEIIIMAAVARAAQSSSPPSNQQQKLLKEAMQTLLLQEMDARRYRIALVALVFGGVLAILGLVMTSLNPVMARLGWTALCAGAVIIVICALLMARDKEHAQVMANFARGMLSGPRPPDRSDDAS